MLREVTVFNKVRERPEFNYSGAQIVEWTGFDKSAVSRFLNGKTDLPMSKFFHLIGSMPTPFQQAYWSELLNLDYQDRSWRSLISQASYADIEEILNAIAERWACRNRKERTSSPTDREPVSLPV